MGRVGLGVLLVAVLAGTSSAQWHLVRQLTAPDEFANGANSEFGQQLALDGDVVVVGAPEHRHVPVRPSILRGAVYVFERGTGAMRFERNAATDLAGYRELGKHPIRLDQGRMYTRVRVLEPGSVFRDVVLGLSLADGALEFSYALDIDTLLADYDVQDGLLLLGSTSDGGSVWSVDTATGDTVASYSPTNLEADDGYGASVVLESGRVFAGATGDDDAGPDAGAVHVFDALDGALAGKLPGFASGSGTTPARIAGDAGVLAVASMDGSPVEVRLVDPGTLTLIDTWDSGVGDTTIHLDRAGGHSLLSVWSGPHPHPASWATALVSGDRTAWSLPTSGAVLQAYDYGTAGFALASALAGDGAVVSSLPLDVEEYPGLVQVYAPEPLAPWVDDGPALPGAGGAPRLLGDGPASASSVNALLLEGALPLATSWVVAGIDLSAAPFHGGVLGPAPDLVLGPFTNYLTGQHVLPVIVPEGLPVGLLLWAQQWTLDPSASHGLSASNTLRITIHEASS